jgi:hypothetical protein
MNVGALLRLLVALKVNKVWPRFAVLIVYGWRDGSGRWRSQQGQRRTSTDINPLSTQEDSMSRKQRLKSLEQAHSELLDAYHRLLLDRDRHRDVLKKVARPADYGMHVADAVIAADKFLKSEHT